MNKIVQCPNCISYKVIIIKKLHYSILLGIFAPLALYCLWFILTERDAGLMGMAKVGGAFIFTILSALLTVKVTGDKKADAYCLRCGFRFKTSKY